MEESHIKINVKASTWEEAIKAAGGILVEVGASDDAYVLAMVDAVKELGPYIVITPHVALAHARPSKSVYRPEMSLAILEEPVEFGSAANDPVKLVFAFCATDDASHLEQLGHLANKLNPEAIEKLMVATSKEDVLNILK